MRSTILGFAVVLVLGSGALGQDSFPAPGFQTNGLAYDGAYLYATENSGFRTIFVIDPLTGSTIDSFLGPSPNGFDGGGNPGDLAFDGAGRLFVSDIAGVVYEIDTMGTTLFNSFALPFRGGAIAFDGMRLYIGDFDSSQILVTDPSGVPIETIDAGVRSAALAYDPALDLFWAISQFERSISQLTREGEIVRVCEGPRDPGSQGLGGITRVGGNLYIAEAADPSPPPQENGTVFVVDPAALTCDPPLFFDVRIDIKPGNPANVVNPRGWGLLTVALLGDLEFNIAGVDASTIRFGATGTEASPRQVQLVDVNADGWLDLRLRFHQGETDIRCGDEVAYLRGRTEDGRAFVGSDGIRTVGCQRSLR